MRLQILSLCLLSFMTMGLNFAIAQEQAPVGQNEMQPPPPSLSEVEPEVFESMSAEELNAIPLSTWKSMPQDVQSRIPPSVLGKVSPEVKEYLSGVVGPQGSSSPPAQAQSNTAAGVGEVTSLPPTDDLATVLESYLPPDFMRPYEYDPTNRRDPFEPPQQEKPRVEVPDEGILMPLQRYALNQLRLVGVMWDVVDARALIEDPTGGTHLVKVRDKIGQKNGYVALIREGELVIVEPFVQEGKRTFVTRIMPIQR